MTRDRRDPPPSDTASTGRDARLAEALRANLHRRKAQARARADDRPGGEDAVDSDPTAGDKGES